MYVVNFNFKAVGFNASVIDCVEIAQRTLSGACLCHWAECA